MNLQGQVVLGSYLIQELSQSSLLVNIRPRQGKKARKRENEHGGRNGTTLVQHMSKCFDLSDGCCPTRVHCRVRMAFVELVKEVDHASVYSLVSETSTFFIIVPLMCYKILIRAVQ